MQKTINHTGRRKVMRDELQIVVNEHEHNTPDFDVTFNLKKNKLPNDACIYIEAYKNNTIQRFSFGTVANIIKPADTRLDQLDLTAPTLFRIRIVDESGHHGRLIASADKIRPESDEKEKARSCLLPVRTRPLEQLTWKVDFETGEKPVLCINSKIPDAKGQLVNNPQFQSLVLPAAMRQVLMYYLWNEETDDDDKLAGEWVRFAEHLHVERPHENDPLMLMQWIDDVVTEFCRRFEMTDKLLQKMEEASS